MTEDRPARDLTPALLALGMRDLTQPQDHVPHILPVRVVDDVSASMPDVSPRTGWRLFGANAVAPPPAFHNVLAIGGAARRGVFIEWIAATHPVMLGSVSMTGTSALPLTSDLAATSHYPIQLPGRGQVANAATVIAYPDVIPRARFGTDDTPHLGLLIPTGINYVNIWVDQNQFILIADSAEAHASDISVLARVPVALSRQPV